MPLARQAHPFAVQQLADSTSRAVRDLESRYTLPFGPPTPAKSADTDAQYGQVVCVGRSGLTITLPRISVEHYGRTVSVCNLEAGFTTVVSARGADLIEGTVTSTLPSIISIYHYLVVGAGQWVLAGGG